MFDVTLLSIIGYSFCNDEEEFDKLDELFKLLKETHGPSLRTANFNLLLNAILIKTIDQEEGFFGTLAKATEAL